MSTTERLTRFPAQGGMVRMVEAPVPWMEHMIGWQFVVTRQSKFGWLNRLRAEYQHTSPGPLLELVFTDRPFKGPDPATFFEGA
jgi:hypothetical protein